MTQKYQVKVSMKQAAIVETGIVLKQGDFGMQLEIEVLDFDATGTTPQIVFRKAMGAVESTTITVSSNKYTYTFKGTELDTPGKVFCDLKLKNSTTQRISTASFMFKVVADTLDGLTEESNSYSDTIAQIVNGFDDKIDSTALATKKSNIVSNTTKVYFPIKKGSSVLFETIGGENFTTTQINLYGKDGNYITYYGLINHGNRRLITMSTSEDAYYWSLLGGTYQDISITNLNSDEMTSEINNAVLDFTMPLEWEMGAIVGGNNQASRDYIRTKDYFYLPVGRIITFEAQTVGYDYGVYYYGKNKVYDSTGSFNITTTASGTDISKTIEKEGYYRIRAKQNPTANMSKIGANPVTWVKIQPIVGEAIPEAVSKFTRINLELGAIVGGADRSSDVYVRTKYFWLNAGESIKVYPASADIYFCYYYYGENQIYISGSSEFTVSNTGAVEKTVANSGYYRLRLRYKNTATISDITDFNVDIPITSIDQRFANSISTNLFDYINGGQLPTAWKNAINDVQEAQGTNFSFAIQTDTHFALISKTSSGGGSYPANDDNYLTCLKQFTQYVGFDFVANLGDLIRGYQFDTQDEMRTAMTEAMHRYTDGICCPFMIAVGNHEDDMLWTHDSTSGTGHDLISETIQPPEQYSKLFMPANNSAAGRLINPEKAIYYYMDFKNVRVIVLNTRDLPYEQISPSDVWIEHHAISQEQVSWFTNTALNTDKQVIVMCHVPLLETLSEHIPDNASSIISAMTAFINNGGTIIGVMCGHTHRQDSAISDNINHIVFANGGDFAEIVNVDTDNKTISTKMVGNYGTKTDRSFTYT